MLHNCGIVIFRLNTFALNALIIGTMQPFENIKIEGKGENCQNSVRIPQYSAIFFVSEGFELYRKLKLAT